MIDSGTSIAAIGFTLAAFAMSPIGSVIAQPPEVQSRDVVPRDVRKMYERGLQFLAASQSQDGSWDGGQPGPDMDRGLENAARVEGSWAAGGKQGPGVTALALLAFLASGEDANFGIYGSHIRKALRSLIRAQDARTGYIGPSMYHHGFAMLALAEAYGTVDDRNLWLAEKAPRSIGQALELAVRTAITSQKSNPSNAWRYSPSGQDADVSVTGAVIIGLLAARNAGIEVPDESIDKAIAYLRSMTETSGDVSYENFGNKISTSMARVAIVTLACAVARRKDLAEYKATLGYLKERIQEPIGPFGEYTLYYEAQALFQGNVDAWGKWNEIVVRRLKEAQQPDGSIRGRFNPPISTSLSLLSLALNYRLLPVYER
ncbi:MAG TPA: squalene--hopene cyclase [Planctomycetaceae bacterium]|nr:squalene--hopene cyclase [Planctomycetaceae bacterium]